MVYSCLDFGVRVINLLVCWSILDSDRLIIKKVEPWNSVKVTVKIPKDAAERLKHLVAQNDGAALRSMGVMSVQLEGKYL